MAAILFTFIRKQLIESEREMMDLLKKRWLLLVVALSVFALLYGQDKAASFENITARQVYEKLQKGEKPLLVDVRTEEEYTGPLGHIDGALLIPLHTIDQRYKELLPYKDREIIVYCRSGNRSVAASEILTQKGFKVKNMLGGMKAWNELKISKK